MERISKEFTFNRLFEISFKNSKKIYKRVNNMKNEFVRINPFNMKRLLLSYPRKKRTRKVKN